MHKHIDWKPYLAHILGFNSSFINEHYKIEIELTELQKSEKSIYQELDGKSDDISKIEGLLLLKQNEVEAKQTLLERLDFHISDKEQTKNLVDNIDEQIIELNKNRYYLSQNKKKIDDSLKEQEILFDPNEAAKLFEETGIFFKGQLKKDFVQLIDFNRKITSERKKYLSEDLREIENQLKNINIELNVLNKKRSEILSFLSESDIFNKYKKISDELVTIKTDIGIFENQKKIFQNRQKLRKEIRLLTESKEKLEELIEENVNEQNSNNHSLFSLIRVYFSEIIEYVIDRKALLNVSLNQKYHLEFSAEILDEQGNTTSESRGFTYQKLLCIAFDMAVARAHADDYFPHFIFHDGIFESLDDRKKQNLLDIIRTYSINYGIQHIITLIDSDLPSGRDYNAIFDNSEIIIILHDKDKLGRLFKMESW